MAQQQVAKNDEMKEVSNYEDGNMCGEDTEDGGALCVCGKKFTVILASKCYGGNGVVCDQCHETVDKNDFLYHCPDGRSEAHRLGSDMCQDCAKKKV